MHVHHPRMVPAPHVRIVVDLISETLLNRETLLKSVQERAAKIEKAATKKELHEARNAAAGDGLQWNERGERGTMAGAADVPKPMVDPIQEEYRRLMMEQGVG